jgi:hypothetical protein
MTGGLMQLVAYGAQDIYLTGNPMITYFKVVYRRHTNFAMESVQQTFNGTADFGNTVSCLISRNGDLVSGIMLEATLPGLPAGGGDAEHEHRWVDNVGHYLMSRVYIEIGGQKIDEHFSDWFEIWSQLTLPAGQREGYLKMIGQDPKDAFGQPTGLQNPGSPASLSGRTIYVPLQFWFCRNVGLALPLIALQYHEVKINVTFNSASRLYTNYTGDPVTALGSGLDNVSFWVDYIYLDTDERRRFAQVSHEYLIEQLQTNEHSYTTTGVGTANVAMGLTINHPVKELVWVCKPTRIDDELVVNQPNNYTTVAANIQVPPLRNIVPDVQMVVTSTLPKTEDNDVNLNHLHGVGTLVNSAVGNHTHNVNGTTGTDTLHTHSVNITSDGAGSHNHTISGNTASTDLTHKHPYSRISNIELVYTYGNYTVDAARHEYSDSVSVTPATTLVTSVDSTLDITGIKLASVTTSQNFVSPVVDVNGTIKQGVNPVVNAKLQLNGHDRFATRSGSYFNLVTTGGRTHTNTPVSPGINVYSFALRPEDHQPSGSCNFSRIDNARLCMLISYPSSGAGHVNSGTIYVYATNYNVLRIMSGMGGLAYSN